MKLQHYERHSTVDLNEVLGAIANAPAAAAEQRVNFEKVRAVFNGVRVKVNTLRLQTFHVKGTTCIACGLQASFFAIESNQPSTKDPQYHLNLYGVNEQGEEVLFTHDHTIARSVGGADHLSNTQTMCTICNFNKSLVEPRRGR